MARCVLGVIDEGRSVKVETSGRKSTAIVVERWTSEDIGGLPGKRLAIQTLSPVLRDEPSISRDVRRTWLK